MFRLSVLQNQWLIFSLMGALAILLGVILTYIMMWRPRVKEEYTDKITDLVSFFKVIPLIVIVLVFGIAVYSIVHVVILSFYPVSY